MRVVGEGIFGYGPEDFVAGTDGAEEVAGDFGLAGEALAIVHGDLENTKAQAMGLDLHFDGPAVVGVDHMEAVEGFPENGAEGPEVGITRAEEETQESGGEPVAEGLGQSECAGTAGGNGAGAEDEVGGTVEEGS